MTGRTKHIVVAIVLFRAIEVQWPNCQQHQLQSGYRMGTSLRLNLVFLVYALTTLNVRGDVLSTCPNTVFRSTPPTDIRVGREVDDNIVIVFNEEHPVVLTSTLKVDADRPGIFVSSDPAAAIEVGPGQSVYVNSHYIHYDSRGLGLDGIIGCVTFDTPIAGVIATSAKLRDTDTFAVGNQTDYPGDFSFRGIFQCIDPDAGFDFIRIGPSLLDLQFGLFTTFDVDQLRVLTYAFGPGQAECQIDVVFLVDTSDSMGTPSNPGELDGFCRNIGNIVTALFQDYVDVRILILGINSTRSPCVTQTVAEAFGQTGVPGNPTCGNPIDNCSGQPGFDGSEENWAAAVAITAGAYPWRPGSKRLIIPFSDEAPCCGCALSPPNPCDCDAGDSEALINAKNRALSNGVKVSPILGNGVDQCVIDLAQEIADYTDGTLLQVEKVDGEHIDEIIRLIEDACIDTPMEQCCFSDGLVDFVEEGTCASLGGVVNDPNVGLPVFCCLTSGIPQIVGSQCCSTIGGVVADDPGVFTEPQACCLPDNSCSSLDPTCCHAFGGTSKGIETTCLPDDSGNGISDTCDDRGCCYDDNHTFTLTTSGGCHGIFAGVGRCEPQVCFENVASGIPTVSEWGLLMMTLLTLTAGTIVIRKFA